MQFTSTCGLTITEYNEPPNNVELKVKKDFFHSDFISLIKDICIVSEPLKCYLNEIFVSEIFAPICSFEYADHHQLICFGKKEAGRYFFSVQILNFTQKDVRALVPSQID